MATAPSVKQEQSERSKSALIDAATGPLRRARLPGDLRPGDRRASGRQPRLDLLATSKKSKEGLLWAVVERSFRDWEIGR